MVGLAAAGCRFDNEPDEFLENAPARAANRATRDELVARGDVLTADGGTPEEFH
ncbi:hypothetical protein [Williamsia sp. D3]|uniref:hypothetical protein n=1 Tax=Williamsia sp. D3 TaxID=1313067 RepID=UPI00041B6699|nr:hypothetical protein [Williamsia sp. D3]